MSDLEFYRAMRLGGRFFGTITRAVDIRAQRNARRLVLPQLPGKYARLAAKARGRRSVPVVVPLGEGHDYLAAAQAANPRLREWSLGQQSGITTSPWPGEPIHPWRIISRGDNRNWSKKSTFQRGIIVQSCATCTDFRVCVLQLNGQTHTIRAPRGWRWDIDCNGLRLRSCSAAGVDYHPTASELIGDVRELPKLARANAAKRRELAKRAAKERRIIRDAEKEGLAVCLRDSVRAGNCETGSKNWATRHHLDHARHYTPAQLLAVANGDTSLVAIVVLIAARRHQREMAAGVCQLEDHR